MKISIEEKEITNRLTKTLNPIKDVKWTGRSSSPYLMVFETGCWKELWIGVEVEERLSLYGEGRVLVQVVNPDPMLNFAAEKTHTTVGEDYQCLNWYRSFYFSQKNTLPTKEFSMDSNSIPYIPQLKNTSNKSKILKTIDKILHIKINECKSLSQFITHIHIGLQETRKV